MEKERQTRGRKKTGQPGKVIEDSIKFVGPGDPEYPFALARELSHHTIGGRLIRGIVKTVGETKK